MATQNPHSWTQMEEPYVQRSGCIQAKEEDIQFQFEAYFQFQRGLK